MDISNSFIVVLVNYFNEDEIVSFVKNSLMRQKGLSDIIIVNNGSHEEQKLNSLNIIYSNVKILSPDKNLGYLGGFIFAYENSPVELTPWLVLANSDIEFSNENNLLDLLKFGKGEEIVLMGPSIISTRTNHNQNPFYSKRISVFKLNFLRIIYKWYIFYFIYQLLYNIKSKLISFCKVESRGAIWDVYSIHASLFMIRNLFVKKNLTAIRKAPFLFGEEIYLSEIALSESKKVIVADQVKIYHHEHATTRLFKSKETLFQLQQSLNALYKNRKSERQR